MNKNKNKIDNNEVNSETCDLEFDDSGQVKDGMKESLSSATAIDSKDKLPLLDFPAEIRNNIYAMVLDDIVPNRPAGCHPLSQPALARVNRQLRSEVLPMWYGAKTFSITIQPRRHSEVDQVWQRFLDRFRAHTAGADGSHYLSSIQRINVVLWNPALEPGFDPADSFLWREVEHQLAYRQFRRTGVFRPELSNRVSLEFGPRFRWELDGRSKGNGVDWADRVAVSAALKAGILGERRGELSSPRLAKFWETYPFERLVDLAMVVGGECKDAARFLYFGLSLAHLDASFPYRHRERYARETQGFDAMPF